MPITIRETSMPLGFETPNDLPPPGAGLPALERAALDITFKTVAVFLPDKWSIKLFRREANELLRLASGEDESYDVFHQLLIPRVIGIEDSSRYWSVMMVLEHLCLSNRDMLDTVKALAAGIVPRGEIDIALYKPSPDVGYDVLDRYRELSDEYCGAVQQLLQSRGSLPAAVRFKHPWFGLLTAHQWHCLTTVHQRIHRRQMQKIVAMLGVT